MSKATSTGLYLTTLNGQVAMPLDLGCTTSITRTTTNAFPNSLLNGFMASSKVKIPPKFHSNRAFLFPSINNPLDTTLPSLLIMGVTKILI